MAKNPLTAIKRKCKECSGGLVQYVEECGISECSIWPFRFGMMPEEAAKQGKYVGEYANVCGG